MLNAQVALTSAAFVSDQHVKQGRPQVSGWALEHTRNIQLTGDLV